MNDRFKELESVFDAAMDLASPQERERYLNEACAGDPALRREVDALLQSGEAAEVFFQAGREACRVAEATPVPVLTEKPGDRIGRYKLLEQIGEGGMGVVYMAEQRDPVVRKVALKIVKPGMDSRQVVARFEAERQALALMDHPNIARVLDGGVTESGRPYFVMDLVQGLPITKFCDEAGLSTHDRLGLFLDVCSAVQHAHQKGVIHRDLKPTNILVTLHGDKPVPKVIDFGVAKAIQGRLTDKTLFTSFQQFVGTPAYMSPEQASLSGLDIDTRSDIYSLGVLLYELLTDQTPFDAQELIKSGLDEMRRKIREQEPVRPSTRLSTLAGKALALTARRRQANVTELMTAVRGDLDWIVMKCLEKDRSRRYETANGLAMDIQRHFANEPVVARPPSQWYRLQKLVRRNKFAVAAASIMAVTLICGLSFSTWSLTKERRALRRAIEAEKEQGRLLKEADGSRRYAEKEGEKARTEAGKSQQVAQFLKDMLKGVGPSVALGRDTKLLREILDQTSDRVGNDLKNQPAVEAELRNTLGEVYKALGEYQKAEAMHRRALELRRKLLGDRDPDVATSAYNLAIALDVQDKVPEAEALYHEALKLRRELYGEEHPDVATSLNGIASILERQFKFPECEAIYRQVVLLEGRLHGREHRAFAKALYNLVNPLRKQHKLDEAESVAGESLGLRLRLYGSEHPDVAQSMFGLASVFYEQGKFVEAEALDRAVLALDQKLRAGPAQMASALFHLGRTIRILARDADRRTEAESFMCEALTIRRSLYTNNHPYVFSIIDELAPVLLQQGKHAEAETLYREAVAIHKQRADPFKGNLAESLKGLAATLLKQGKLAEAENASREAFQFCLEWANAGEPRAQLDLALIYATGRGVAKDLAAATNWFRKAGDQQNSRFLNEAAWSLATSGDPATRDGSTAVMFAEKAVVLTSRTNASYIDTLAAAYAESGQFDKAVAVQKEAIALNKDEALRNELGLHLKLYESKTPCREN